MDAKQSGVPTEVTIVPVSSPRTRARKLFLSLSAPTTRSHNGHTEGDCSVSDPLVGWAAYLTTRVGGRRKSAAQRGCGETTAPPRAMVNPGMEQANGPPLPFPGQQGGGGGGRANGHHVSGPSSTAATVTNGGGEQRMVRRLWGYDAY